MFKSKGTRKSIEILLRLIGAPEMLVEFNEYIYIADQKINLNDFEKKHPEIKNNPDFDALKKDVITSRITSVLEFVERVKALKGGE